MIQTLFGSLDEEQKPSFIERMKEAVSRTRENLAERIEDVVSIGKEIDRDGKFTGLLREHETCEPIAVRVLLPVHEVQGWLHRERVARNAGAAVRSRPQPHDLRSEADRPVIIVARGVMEPDKN